jgi:hypothetical protein
MDQSCCDENEKGSAQLLAVAAAATSHVLVGRPVCFFSGVREYVMFWAITVGGTFHVRIHVHVLTKHQKQKFWL